MLHTQAILLLLTCTGLAHARYYFKKGISFDTITDNEATQKGSWTEWIDMDDTTGTGDYESIRGIRYYTQCKKLWCSAPAVMEVGLSDQHKQKFPAADADEIYKCQSISNTLVGVEKGFKCYRYMQYNSPCKNDQAMCSRNGLGDKCTSCADFKVRFFCLESDRTTDAKICQATTPFKRQLSSALLSVLAGQNVKDKGDHDLLEDLDMVARGNVQT